MATTVPEITVVIDGGDTEEERVTSTVIVRGLFARRILVSTALTRMFYENAFVWLENWRANFGYLLPVVVIETIWNVLLVAVSVVILIWSAASKERNVLTLCVLISIYMFHCVLHVVLLWQEYYKRRNSTPTQISPYGRWECYDIGMSYLWFAIIVICLMAGKLHFKILLHDAPRLFWLTLGFLASSELFLTSLMVCFCSIVWLILKTFGKARYFEGASENDISDLPNYICELPNYICELPNYIFELNDTVEQNDGKAGRMIPTETNDQDSSNEIPTDDVDCGICLDLYENGSELMLLPCKHNFHAACIRKWLSIQRICPMCKQELK